jgi:hypothetical protein
MFERKVINISITSIMEEENIEKNLFTCRNKKG